MTDRLTQDNINKLAGLIGTDWRTADRAGFYLEYYNLLKQYAPSNNGGGFSASDLMLLQASIATYSGFAGGGALLGNALAKFANPDAYNVSLDQFSWNVANGLFQKIVNNWNEGGTGILDTSDVFRSDNKVWSDLGLLEYFPGQAIQYNIDYTKLFTAGTLSAALSGLELLFGAQVGFTEADRIGQGTLDTSNPDYTVIRDPAGRVIWVQENVGALDRIFPLPQSVLNDPGQGLVDLISNYFGIGDSLAFATLVVALKTATNVAGLANDAAGRAVAQAAEDTLDSFYSGTTVDFDLRDDLKSFLGADYADIKPDGTLPNTITFGDLPLVLKHSGTFVGDDSPSIAFGYATADITTGAGQDLLFGFGQASLHGGAGNDLLIGTDDAKLYGDAGNDKIIVGGNATGDGGDGNDLLVAFQSATAKGGAGDDIVLGWNAQITNRGDLVNSKDDPPQEGQPDARLRAPEDLHMTLDGGTGDDWVIEIGGTGAVTAGGLGRDFILNTSADGIIWGDVADSILDKTTDRRYTLATTTNPDGTTSTTKQWIADDASNADNFAWSPGTTVEDPQRHDILTFFGVPLVGGADNGGIGLSLAGFGLAGAVIGAAQVFTSPLDTLYVDQLLPFITYSFKKEADGSYDLIVGNVLQAFLDATEAAIGSHSGLSAKLKQHLGVMTFKDFIPVKDHGLFAVSYGGAYQAALTGLGKLGLVFEKENPVFAILAALPPDLLTLAAEGGGPLVDEALTASAAVTRFATALSWYGKTDPLVLDLSGSGLVTTSLDQSSVHFDLANDLFAVRTGWLASGAGFLVLDKNGNGVIDDASEMFGATTGSGFGDLALYDTNHDGVIDAGDAVFSKLQVWVDANGDGVTDAGELHTLSDLGITSIALNSVDLGASATADGTTLSAASSFTYADGTSGQIYDATFPTDPTDTLYEGQTGAPAWAGPATIDARGFGHVTNLAIATANDVDLAALVATTAAAMTTPDLRTLVDQAGAVLGAWGETLNQTRELDPVLLVRAPMWHPSHA